MTQYRAKLIMKDGTFVDLQYTWPTLVTAYIGVGVWVNTRGTVGENIVGFQVYKEHVNQ